MLEAATSGAKVLHNRAVGVAKKFNIPITVRCYNKKGSGTVVEDEKINKTIEDYGPKIVSIKKDLAKITVTGEGLISDAKYISKITKAAATLQIHIYQISISEVSIGVVVENIAAEPLADLILKELFIR